MNTKNGWEFSSNLLYQVEKRKAEKYEKVKNEKIAQNMWCTFVLFYKKIPKISSSWYSGNQLFYSLFPPWTAYLEKHCDKLLVIYIPISIKIGLRDQFLWSVEMRLIQRTCIKIMRNKLARNHAKNKYILIIIHAPHEQTLVSSGESFSPKVCSTCVKSAKRMLELKIDILLIPVLVVRKSNHHLSM